MGREFARLIAIKRCVRLLTVCSGRLQRKRGTLLPLLEHAIADVGEFYVLVDVGAKFLGGVRNRGGNAFEYLPDAGRGTSHARLAQALQLPGVRPFVAPLRVSAMLSFGR